MAINWRTILPHDTLSGLQFFQLFRYASVFLISIILPRAGLSTADIGLFESFLFFAALVSYFWLTGLIQALLPLAKDDGEKGHASRFFNATFLLLIFSALAGLAIWLAGPWLSRLVGKELPAELVGIVILYLILFAPSTLVEYGYVMQGKTRWLVRYAIIAFSLQILAVGIPVVAGLGIRGAIWGMVGAGAFRMAWLIAVLIRNGEFRIRFSFLKEYLVLGFPVILSVLISGSAPYVSGFIVSTRFDAEAFALFRYGARELPLVALLAHALSSAMIPVIARDGIPAGLKMLKERSQRMASWMFPLTVGLLLSGYFLFPLVYGRSFLESAGVFNLYLLLITSRLLFPQTILLALKKTRIQLIASILELTLNVGLSLLLAQAWGIRGVALATVAAYAFERIFLMTYTRVILGIPVRQYVSVRPFLIWTLVLAGTYLLSEFVLYPLIAAH